MVFPTANLEVAISVIQDFLSSQPEVLGNHGPPHSINNLEAIDFRLMLLFHFFGASIQMNLTNKSRMANPGGQGFYVPRFTAARVKTGLIDEIHGSRHVSCFVDDNIENFSNNNLLSRIDDEIS